MKADCVEEEEKVESRSLSHSRACHSCVSLTLSVWAGVAVCSVYIVGIVLLCLVCVLVFLCVCSE